MQNVVNLTVRKPYLVLPALQQILGLIGPRHSLGKVPKMCFVPHPPIRDGFHAGRRVVGACERYAAELRAQLLKPLAKLAEEIGAPSVFVLEGQP